MEFLKEDQVFLEQVAYPEHRQEERFLRGLRGLKATYIYQVDLTRGGIKTYWGVRKRAWWGEPEITKYQKALLGGLITDYPMPETSFRVVKHLPPWPLPPEETLTLQLAESPALYRTNIQVQVAHYPITTTVSGSAGGFQASRRSCGLLEILRNLVRFRSQPVFPVSLRVLWKPTRPGTTRMRKQKRRAGERWTEDTDKIITEQIKITEHSIGRRVGYWTVSVLFLAPWHLKELLPAVNKDFHFQEAKSTKGLKQYHGLNFGKKIRMSSIYLARLVQIPTGDLLTREFLNAPTTGEVLGRQQVTQPFPCEGYLLGHDGDGQDLCLNDAMLRAHVLICGRSGCRKTSYTRFLSSELIRNPANRLLILDYAGEYAQLMEQLPGCVLLRPGSDEFPLGINFLDWAKRLGVDAFTAESWILKILWAMLRGKEGAELTPKMETMLREIIHLELERGGDLYAFFKDLKKLRTQLAETRAKLMEKKQQGELLTEEEELTLRAYGNHDLTIDALQNRLRDLYASPLRRVFYVRQTTVQVEDLLDTHVIIDLSELRRQEISRDLLRLFNEFLLVYISRGLAMRKKGRIQRRNIVIFEEAQMITPELLRKKTLVDGTMPEEVIGTLGGFGLSLIFVSAQPNMLSRAVLAGTHTKVVFGVQGGKEANLIAEALEVEPNELMSLQTGECLVKAVGTGVCKAYPRTIRAAPEQEIARIEAWQSQSPPALLEQSRIRYEFINKVPVGLFSSLITTIEQQTESPIETKEELGSCWAAVQCQLCEENPGLVTQASKLTEKYWKKKKKEEIRTRLTLYPQNPQILYDDLLELAQKEQLRNPELVAFCAHWVLFTRCAGNRTMQKACPELFHRNKEELVDLFLACPEMNALLEVSQDLSGAQLVFSARDEFCDICPLERPLREDFCARYRREAFLKLRDSELRMRLRAAYEAEYQEFLRECFVPEISTNPSFCYCVATTFLRSTQLTPKQRDVVMELTKKFLQRRERENAIPQTHLTPWEEQIVHYAKATRKQLCELLDLPDSVPVTLKQARHVVWHVPSPTFTNAIEILDQGISIQAGRGMSLEFQEYPLAKKFQEWKGLITRLPFNAWQKMKYTCLLKKKPRMEQELLDPTEPNWEEAPGARSLESEIKRCDETKQDGNPPRSEEAVWVVQELLAQRDGVVARSELEQMLREKQLWRSKDWFATLVAQLGLRRFLMPKPIENSNGKKYQRAGIYFVAPDCLGKEPPPLDILNVIHDFACREIKNQFQQCDVTDGGRTLLTGGQAKISDLTVQCGDLITHIEFTGGGKPHLSEVIKKIAENPRRAVALVVCRKKPYKGKKKLKKRFVPLSNKKMALEIIRKLGLTHVDVFTLAELDELRAWCMTRKRDFNHRTS